MIPSRRSPPVSFSTDRKTLPSSGSAAAASGVPLARIPMARTKPGRTHDCFMVEPHRGRGRGCQEQDEATPFVSASFHFCQCHLRQPCLLAKAEQSLRGDREDQHGRRKEPST